MTDKEQIIIDGKKYNKCEGCELYDGYMCNGARSYEPEGEAHRAICDKHIAQEFWKVYNQLARKTQECEELKKKLRKLELENTTLQNRYQQIAGTATETACYRKALEEIDAAIATYSSKHQYSIANDLYNQIFDIINKAKE